jgi:hypothetical protein
LRIGLGYWSYHGVRNAIAETQASGLEALLGTAVRGLEVWVDFFFLAANRNWKF